MSDQEIEVLLEQLRFSKLSYEFRCEVIDALRTLSRQRDKAQKAVLLLKELRLAQLQYNYVRTLYMCTYRTLDDTHDRLTAANNTADSFLESLPPNPAAILE